MKKKIIISIIILLIIIALVLIIYKCISKKNDKKLYIVINYSISPGITTQYIPSSRYNIYKTGEVEYITNVDKNEKEKLKKLKNSELEEIYNIVVNSSAEPINNKSINPRGRRRVL